VVDELGAIASGSVAIDVVPNSPPTLGVDIASVTGNEGTTIINTGTWADPDVPANNVTLTASAGTITKNVNGTWAWQLAATDQSNATNVLITADDGLGGNASVSFTYTISNVAPTLTRLLSNVNGDVLSVITNLGTYSDVAADTISLSVSAGTIVDNSNGTWSWSITPSAAVSNQTVTITALDEDGGTSTVTFLLTARVAISNSRLFYNNSTFELNGTVAAALDTLKTPLRANNVEQTTSFANISNYSRGINGLVLDIAGLNSTALTLADFTFRVSPPGANGLQTPSNWGNAPSPSVISVVPGNATTAARVVLEWPDNQIQNTWLQIIVKANTNTGLTQRAVFYLGHAMGDVDGLAPYRVTTIDVGTVRAVVSNSVVSISDVRDFDKDTRVTTVDVGMIRSRVSNDALLNNITIPVVDSTGEGEGRFFQLAPIVKTTMAFGEGATATAQSNRQLQLPVKNRSGSDFVSDAKPGLTISNAVAKSTTEISNVEKLEFGNFFEVSSFDEYFGQLGSRNSRRVRRF